MKRIAYWMLPAMMVCLGGVWVWAQDDYGDDYTDAAPLTVGVLKSGVLDSNADLDYFWFEGEADTLYSAVAWGGNAWDQVHLFASDADDNFIDDSAWAMVFPTADAGRYHVSCGQWGMNPLAYSLLVQKQTFAFALPGTTWDGRLASARQVDGFAFLADTGKTYAVVMGTDPQANNMWNHRLKLSGQWSLGYPGNPLLVTVSGLQMQYGLVYDAEGAIAPASYAFRAQEITFAPMVDGEATGRIDVDWDMDGFTTPVEVDAKHAAWVTTSSDSWDYRMSVFDPYGNRMSSGGASVSFTPRDAQDHSIVVTASAAKSDDYVVNVQSYVDDLPDDQWDGDPYIAPTDGTVTHAAIQVPPDRDAIGFEVSAGKIYAFHASFDESQNWWFYLNHYDQDGNYVDSMARDAGCFMASADGVNTEVIHYNNSEWTGPVPFDVQITEFTDEDNDNDPDSPRVLMVNAAPEEGSLKVVGDVDWFQFDLVEGQQYILDAGPNKLYAVFNASSSDDRYNRWMDNGDRFYFTAQRTGWIRGYVKCLDGGVGSYQITIRDEHYRPPMPILQVSPESHNFGYMRLGQAATQTFTVVNVGTTNLIVGAITLSNGLNQSSFAIRADGCSGQNFACGTTGTVSVVFAPTSTWGRATALVIPSNDPESPTTTVPVYGTGIDTSSAETNFQAGLSFLRAYESSDVLPHDTNTLIAAEQRFKDALAANSNHYGVCFFESLTRILTVVYDPEVSQMLTDFGVSPAGRDLLDWTAEFPSLLPSSAPKSGRALKVLRQKLIPVFDNALTNLARIPTNWTGSIVVGPAELPIDNEVEVDVGDLQMIQAGLEVFKALLLIQDGYDLDFDFAYLDHLDTPHASITVDGNTNDWAGIQPLLVSPRDVAGGPANADLYRVFTAMDASYAYLMIETYGKPIDASVIMEVNVNYKPGQQWSHGDFDDLHLNISGSQVQAWTNNFVVYPLIKPSVAWGSVLEVSIPLAALGNPSYFAATFVNIWTNGAVKGRDASDIPLPPLSAYLSSFPKIGTFSNIASIASASNCLIRAIDHYLAGSQLIGAETDYQADDLIVFDPEDANAEVRARLWLAQIRDSLTRHVNPSFTMELSQFLDLGSLFANPVALRGWVTGGGVRQALLDQVRSQLDVGLSHLAGAGTGFNQVLRPGESPFARRDVEVDYGDICMMKSYLTGGKALIDLIGSYDTECDIVKLMESDPTLISDFMKTYPRFLAMSNTAYLAAASNLVPAAINYYLTGSQFIRDESDDQSDDLMTIRPNRLVTEAKTRTQLEGLRDSMTGTVLIANAEVYEYVRLGRLFVTNYVTRAHLPTFTNDNQAVEGTFPDPTFNGVLPSNTQWRLARFLHLPHRDADGDTLPDLWEKETFGSETNLPAADNDHDGLSNYEEYRAGTDPNNSRSVFKMDPGPAPESGSFTLRWGSVPYRTYQIYRCTNLMNGFSLQVPFLPATPPTNVYTDVSPGGEERFYRIGVLDSP